MQTPLRPQPSPTVPPQTPILRPGTLVTATADFPQSGTFVQVTTDTGEEGWVLATALRPLAVLEAEQQLEPFSGVEGIQPMDRAR